MIKKYSVDKQRDKGIIFFSVSSFTASKALVDSGIYDILVSFHYLKKNTRFADELLPDIVKNNGYFMTDSGAFSIYAEILKKEAGEEIYTEEYWLPYLEEYVQWLYDHSDYIYVAANLDLDNIVGRDVVDRWNEKYFKPLEKIMNVVYVVQKDVDNIYNDRSGMKRFKEYLSLHEYVGINNAWQDDTLIAASLAKQYKRRLHGFALTSQYTLQQTPFFSHDSTSWLTGDRYGITFEWDGRNFRQYEATKKYIRKRKKLLSLELGIDLERLSMDKAYEIHLLNLHAWKGLRENYLKACRTHLRNNPICFYDKRTH